MVLGNEPCSPTDPSRIQLDERTFIRPSKLLAHSCSPNAYIDWMDSTLKALRRIKKGELVSYHYGTSEDDYRIGAFHCECHSNHCMGEFKGFAFLSDKEKQRIRKFVSPYMRVKYFRR